MWSENPSFANASTQSIYGGSATIKLLTPGHTYYWKVTLGNVSSSVGKFTVLNTPVRWMSVDGLTNMRDLGGWSANGATVKYGLLYRSACIDGYNGNERLTELGKTQMSKELGVKTEIDLRIQGVDDGNHTVCVFGGNYVKVTIGQYDKLFTSDKTEAALKKIFETVSNPANYPIIFHCNAGADRTGTVAFILNGLLGVSYNDLVKDYEMTSFSKRLRYRSKLEGNGFSADGIMRNDSVNYIAFDAFYHKIIEGYSNGGTLAQGLESFVKSYGVTDAQIANFRNIMLG